MQETKRCTKCGEEYPLTAEYWHRDKNTSDGFDRHCKQCRLKWREANREKLRENSRRYAEANPDKMRENTRKWREANLDKVRESGRKSARKWRKNNPDKVREYKLRYRESNTNKERKRVRESVRRYYKANPDKAKIKFQRYRARKRAMPDTITAQDWQYALTYFNGCCAVCGRQLNDLFGEHTAAMDHWIPLSSDDCPGTIPENVVPLCHGIDGCNNSKHAKDPETWLIETYGTRKARQIMARIQAYFDSLPGSTDEDQGAA